MNVYLLSVILFTVLADNVKCSKSIIDKFSNDKREEIVKNHDKYHRKEKPTEGIVKKHYIYPRTGRLFTADARRDNLIFDSLERTNFMRRGDFLIPHKRYQRDVFANQRKHFLFRSDAEKNKLNNNVEEKERKEAENTRNVYRQSKGFLFTSDVHKRNRRDTKTDNQINETSKRTNDVTNDKLIAYVETNTDNKDQDKIKAYKENENKPTRLYKTKFFQHAASQEMKENEDKATIKSYEDSIKILKSIYLQQTSDKSDSVDGEKEITSGVPHPAGRPTERRLVPTPNLTAKLDVPVVRDYTAADLSNSTDNEDKDLAEGRSRRKLKKYALPFLLALKMKTAILLPLMFGIVTLVAFKGLWAGITALGISAALGLKALINNSSKVLYEIRTTAPHYYHYAPDYAEYWNRRTGDDPYRPYRSTGWR